MRIEIPTDNKAEFKATLLENLIAKMVELGKLPDEDCCDGENWYALEDIIEDHLLKWRANEHIKES